LSLAHGQTSLGATTVDLALDGEDRANLVQRLTRNRRSLLPGFGVVA
jgi:hypothetical protein